MVGCRHHMKPHSESQLNTTCLHFMFQRKKRKRTNSVEWRDFEALDGFPLLLMFFVTESGHCLEFPSKMPLIHTSWGNTMPHTRAANCIDIEGDKYRGNGFRLLQCKLKKKFLLQRPNNRIGVIHQVVLLIKLYTEASLAEFVASGLSSFKKCSHFRSSSLDVSQSG